ncbi:Asp/Glu/Hydantoin racemase [Colletotrichum graminicola]|uniref:Asp/Glu/Hydantoin racemase n=1 Tax=Colletotrichum graminicola (strain M1.001 / M2 / FGSC 10212) TaxID=645133 RepID=E3QHL3_COLGM|nr:Asp/Glu/Hydantoin racemase [Colletotrichum graminicola M1.001]EFQ30351.1 Asp/Glu/Hydantoin racemase [Colletotrichum graminicola M1.001]WDK18598.1 Asp/Glu/Hydantoin racemase [Colletotrichum graminicola]
MGSLNRTIRLLCIVPISTTGMTEDLVRIYKPRPGLDISFIDGRGLLGCPPCIENETQAFESTRAVLPRTVDYISSHTLDGVLICCFSNHPLVSALRKRVTIPVTGIFQAALQEATQHGGKFGIVTTAWAWERPLTDSVSELGFRRNSAGVAATGIGPLELEILDREVVINRIATFSKALIDKGAQSIILGCAGMTALEEDILAALPPGIRTVDGVRAGIRILSRLAEETVIMETAPRCIDDSKCICTIHSTQLTSGAAQVP